MKQDQAERSKNKIEKKVCLQDFAFIEVRGEFRNWIWTCVLPLGENTGSWPSRDRTTEPKCLYRSLDSESGIQEVKRELLEGQQIHSPLYLLSYVNKSVNIYIFVRARQVHLQLVWTVSAGAIRIYRTWGFAPKTTFPCSNVFHSHAKDLIHYDS